MHRQPLIGISGSMNTEENQYHINRDYVRSLTEAGAIPLLLAPDMTDEQARQCAEELDGLLLSGGNDVSPRGFGQEPLGGTLIQDLPSQHRREEGLPAMSHRQTALGQYPSHRVEVAEGSLLEQIVGQREIWVNSFHHQAVGEVASCANLSAWAADGVVEAIELPDALFVLGVQWHPEIMTRLEDEASRRLFAAFAKAARG